MLPTESMDTLATLPLYKVQRAALGGRSLPLTLDAATELGRRYALAKCQTWASEQHKRRLAKAFTCGWHGDANPYPASVWSNFMAPLYNAFRAGQQDRKLQESA